MKWCFGVVFERSMEGYFVFSVDLYTRRALLQQTARTTSILYTVYCILYTIIIIDQSVRVGLLLLIMLIRVQGGLSIKIYCRLLHQFFSLLPALSLTNISGLVLLLCTGRDLYPIHSSSS